MFTISLPAIDELSVWLKSLPQEFQALLVEESSAASVLPAVKAQALPVKATIIHTLQNK